MFDQEEIRYFVLINITYNLISSDSLLSNFNSCCNLSKIRLASAGGI